ncbi:MATE efflux family protein [Coprinopsis marcescibilis]|uniref:MATE efflux family protein n=1 Tax=Coprinopsis marcescibilis TaxID=230819 RepID=A0A5C3KQJ2_COPMA|nr:MATE efflux family protein [Coprinopsis marcescibilis]
MSSTYSHYQGPSSLPSDYAILSQYAANRGGDDDGEQSLPDSDETITPKMSSGERRESFSAREQYYRPPNPTMAPPHGAQNLQRYDEYTPLLGAQGPPVPRIEEAVDRDPTLDNESKWAMFFEEFPILIKYSLPVFGTHLLEYTLVIVPVISIGHLSTTALAAVSLGSMTASVTGYSIIQGFCSALDTLLPSAWTSSHPELVGLWCQRMAVVMAATLIPVSIIWFNAEEVLLLLKQDPEVAHLAATYLRWAILGLPAYTFDCISRRYFQSQGHFTIPTRITLCVAPINALLNYLLVWGPDWIRLGFIGAPISTAVSFNLIAIISFAYGAYYVPLTAWHPFTRRMFTSLGVLVHLGLSGVGQTASEWWAWELVALAASMLGPVVLATQSVLLVSASMTFQAPFSLGVATSVRIGNLLGEHKGKRAGVSANTAIIIALMMSLTTSAMFMICRNFWGRLFNDDERVIELVSQIIPLVALFQVVDGNSAITSGILRARGKQFLGALLNLSSYYIIGIPFGMWLTFRCDMGLEGLWIGLTVSLVYCSVLGTTICLRTDWDQEVLKVVKRLEEEDKLRKAEMVKGGGALEGGYGGPSAS